LTVPRGNEEHQELWGSDSLPDMTRVLRSCLGYAACPGWGVMQAAVLARFGGFKDLRTVELGCGEGKVSLLFAVQGAKTTLVDYSEKQMRNARYVAERFEVHPDFHLGNILTLAAPAHGGYDVSMSFGTAEHFFGDDRQAIFDAHARVLKPGGLTFVWVPNRWGFLFHTGVITRQGLGRETCHVDEVPFSRAELAERAHRAGLMEVRIVGADSLKNDFSHFIIDLPRLLRLPDRRSTFQDGKAARAALLATMEENDRRPGFLANHFSYPLLLMGRRPA
jgi:SAM-dependent methyltransferase